MSTSRDTGPDALQHGDIQTAITHLEAAIRQEPNDFQAYLSLGGAYGQAGRQQDAIQVLTAAVRLEPANAQARYTLGIAMEQAGYRDQAVQLFQQALQLQPDYPNGQEALERVQHTPAHGNDGFGAPMQPQNSSTGPQTASTPPSGMGHPAPRDQTALYGQPMGGYTPPSQGQPAVYGAGGSPPQAQPEEVGLAAYGTAPVASYTPPTPSRGPGLAGSSPSGYARPAPEPYPEPCPEADQALVWAFVSWFVCFLLFPVPILRAIRAKSIMKQNPHMTGHGKANAAIIMGVLAIPWQMAMVQLLHMLRGQ